MLITLVYIAVAFMILLLMITVHEFGHYIAGKLLGFRINEFSIGFGKAIFKRTNKKTGEVFAVRMIPMGGYCAFAGDDAAAGEEKSRESAKTREEAVETALKDEPVYQPKGKNFNEQQPWKRLVVLFAGAFANFVFAALFAVVLLMIVGYNQVLVVDEIKTSEHNANLKKGDIIQSIDGQDFTLLKNHTSILGGLEEGQTVVLRLSREGVVDYIDVNVTVHTFVGSNGEETRGLGVTNAEVEYVQLGFFKALAKSVPFCFELVWLILSSLGSLFVHPEGLKSLGGPIATISVMTQSVSASLLNIFILVPLIGVNLAVFNLLPIPALDGARMVFVGIEWARGKPINPNIENRINFIGLIVLLSLVLLADANYLFNRLEFILKIVLRL